MTTGRRNVSLSSIEVFECEETSALRKCGDDSRPGCGGNGALRHDLTERSDATIGSLDSSIEVIEVEVLLPWLETVLDVCLDDAGHLCFRKQR